MSAFFVAATVISSVYSSDQARKSQKKAATAAKVAATEDAVNARKAETFAETEGEGIGTLGQISLEVDDEDDDEDNVSI